MHRNGSRPSNRACRANTAGSLWLKTKPRLPTGLQVRTIGLGVSVQDRFLNEFERRTGHSSSGKVTTLTAMITEWLAGGAKNYDTKRRMPIATRLSGTLASCSRSRSTVSSPGNTPATPTPAKRRSATTRSARYPLVEVWVDPDNQTEFKLVPQFYNCDSIGYRYDLTEEDITSWGSLLDEKYAGKVAILNDSLLTPGWAAGYLKASGQMEIARTDNLTHEELDQVIDFMIERKRAGQFRAIWEDYGQCVNLLASGEVWLADAWNPVVEDVKKQDVVCKYATPKEGFTAWFHGIAVQKDTPNLEAALDYVNFCLEGWWGSQVATQGYYSPTTTCDVYLQSSRDTPARSTPTTSGGIRAAPARSRRKAGRSPAATPGRTTRAGATSCTGWSGRTTPTTTRHAGTISSRHSDSHPTPLPSAKGEGPGATRGWRRRTVDRRWRR